MRKGMRIGVVLSGCGVYDGAEIHESVLTLLEIERLGCESFCLAPDIPQSRVINHLDGSVSGGERNVLEESARIARGEIKNISQAGANDLDGLIFPGGSGAAGNLSDYALKGKDLTVTPEVERLINEMRESRKPMGFICIAPVLAAAVLGEYSPSLTIGNDTATAGVIETLGCRHVEKGVSEAHTDEENLIVSTPAYMLGPGISDISRGIRKLVEEVVRLCG